MCGNASRKAGSGGVISRAGRGWLFSGKPYNVHKKRRSQVCWRPPEAGAGGHCSPSNSGVQNKRIAGGRAASAIEPGPQQLTETLSQNEKYKKDWGCTSVGKAPLGSIPQYLNKQIKSELQPINQRREKKKKWND